MAYADRYEGLKSGLVLKPLRDMFVFHGRSTRTEVVGFWFISMLANGMIGTPPESFGTAGVVASVVWDFLWGFPLIALFIRRLNDQDRSKRWALVLLIALASMAAIFTLPEAEHYTLRATLGPFTRHPETTPAAILLFSIAAASMIALLLLLLSPPTEGTNRYGPDPRLDPEPQDPATA